MKKQVLFIFSTIFFNSLFAGDTLKIKNKTYSIACFFTSRSVTKEGPFCIEPGEAMHQYRMTNRLYGMSAYVKRKSGKEDCFISPEVEKYMVDYPGLDRTLFLGIEVCPDPSLCRGKLYQVKKIKSEEIRTTQQEKLGELKKGFF